MKKCVILDDYQNAALRFAEWGRIDDRVFVASVREHLNSDDKVVECVGDADIVVIMRERTPFPAAVLNRLPNLKLLVTSGPRNVSIDLAAAAKNGVVVSGTTSSGSPPMELTWGLILALARQIIPENHHLRTGGPWQSSVGMDLRGRQLGIIGLGKIGSQIAQVGRAFGMSVAAWSPNLTEERAAAGGVTRAKSKEALLEISDFMTIHLVLSLSTRGLIGAPELRRMKSTAYLINTSRAPIVDQDALVRALEERWIAGAGLDVFETEPLPPDHAFRRLENVLATPHIGYVSQANYKTFFTESLEDIEAWLAGAPLRRITK